MILGKGPIGQGLDNTKLTAEKEHSIHFTEQKKVLSLHYNGDSNYIIVSSVEIYKFQAKNSEINTVHYVLETFQRIYQLMHEKDYMNMFLTLV